MEHSENVLNEAMRLQEEADAGLEAAEVEQQHGQSEFSAQLLGEAIDKERTAIELLEEEVTRLQETLSERRDALERQEQLLRDLQG